MAQSERLQQEYALQQKRLDETFEPLQHAVFSCPDIDTANAFLRQHVHVEFETQPRDTTSHVHAQTQHSVSTDSRCMVTIRADDVPSTPTQTASMDALLGILDGVINANKSNRHN